MTRRARRDAFSEGVLGCYFAASGLDLIRAAEREGLRTPIMPAPDRSRGVGKAKLYDERTVGMLRTALGL